MITKEEIVAVVSVDKDKPIGATKVFASANLKDCIVYVADFTGNPNQYLIIQHLLEKDPCKCWRNELWVANELIDWNKFRKTGEYCRVNYIQPRIT
jgi:hypothetical protein